MEKRPWLYEGRFWSSRELAVQLAEPGTYLVERDGDLLEITLKVASQSRPGVHYRRGSEWADDIEVGVARRGRTTLANREFTPESLWGEVSSYTCGQLSDDEARALNLATLHRCIALLLQDAEVGRPESAVGD